METQALGMTEPLNFESDVPVYEQIGQRIKFAIASGAYSADDKLPSVRALARSLVVNPNTVIRVYRELELAGLIYTKRGRGVFVSAKASGRCEQERMTIVEDKLREALELAQQAQLESHEIEALWRRLRGGPSS